jgi:hypothetical protein
MVKTLVHPHTHKTVKFGRKRSPVGYPHLRFRNYATMALPAPPATCDYSGPAKSELGNIYGNDQYGCCVTSGICHLVGVFNAGGFILTDTQNLALYSAIGGYVPGDSNTDRGCDEVTALNFWLNQGAPIGSHQISGWLAVDPANPIEYRQAVWLFENLVFGLELPDKWITPFPSGNGFTWDVAGNPDPNNGHCIVSYGFSQSGMLVDTWGYLGTITDAAIMKYCASAVGGELYTVIDSDIIVRATNKAPNGFLWKQLAGDFDSLGGGLTLAAFSMSVGAQVQVMVGEAHNLAISNIGWSSSKPSIFTVQGNGTPVGTVTGISRGFGSLTATAIVNGKQISGSCQIEII